MRIFLKYISGPLSFLLFFAITCGGTLLLRADEISVVNESPLVAPQTIPENQDGIPIIDGISLVPFDSVAEDFPGLDENSIETEISVLSPENVAETVLDTTVVTDDSSLTSAQASVVDASGVSVIDDGDSGFSLSTTTGWYKSVGQGYNGDYFMGIGSGKATWSFSVSPGSYRVSITWYNPGAPYNSFFSPAAPVAVSSDKTLLKSTTINLTTTPSDRTDLGTGWKDLGVFTVTSTSLEVSMSALASVYVMADAVRIERIPDNKPKVSVLDDADPGFSLSPANSWFKSTGQGLNGDYYMGIGSGKAIWSFPVSPGSYRVSITWYNPGAPYDSFFSTAAPVSVTSSSTLLMTTNLNLRTTPSDRTDFGVGWKDLGVFSVTSSSLEVTLSEVASLYVIADGVRIERTDKGALAPAVALTVPKDSPLLGGVPVSIFGSEFVNGSQVFFGTRPSSQVTFVSSTQLIALTPPNARGVFEVKVVTPQGLTGSLQGKFRYAVGRTLDDGEVGFQTTSPAVTAIGAGFQNDFVFPGGTPRTSTASWTIPVRKQKLQKVAVTWYDAGAPYNAFFANDVRFDVMDGDNVLKTVVANLQTKPASFTDQGVGWLSLGTFAFASGKVKIVLRNNTDNLLMADAIRVQELFPAPILTSVALDPKGLAGETSIILSGSRFIPGAVVMFGNVPADHVSYMSSTSLKATMSSVLIGTSSITVINPDGQNTSSSSITF